jgi:hypothetical protein
MALEVETQNLVSLLSVPLRLLCILGVKKEISMQQFTFLHVFILDLDREIKNKVI